MQARRLSPSAMHNLYIYIMRVYAYRHLGARTSESEIKRGVYLCTPFHEGKGGIVFARSVSTRRGDDADHPGREASIFRLRKWVDPPQCYPPSAFFRLWLTLRYLPWDALYHRPVTVVLHSFLRHLCFSLPHSFPLWIQCSFCYCDSVSSRVSLFFFHSYLLVTARRRGAASPRSLWLID